MNGPLGFSKGKGKAKPALPFEKAGGKPERLASGKDADFARHEHASGSPSDDSARCRYVEIAPGPAMGRTGLDRVGIHRGTSVETKWACRTKVR